MSIVQYKFFYKKFTFFTILFFAISYLEVLAQTAVELNKVISPSPNAASLGNFGNNSKGTYNGVPEITIPLFQNLYPNQAGNISLSYDASGTKVAQQSSWVGLGWSLAFGGGVIMRTVRGMDDLYNDGYHVIDTIPSYQTLDSFYSSGGSSDPNMALRNYLLRVRNGLHDTEPDIFNFSIGNYNGKFVLDKTARGSSVLQLDGSNLAISYLNPGWMIIDGDGNKYFFNKQEYSDTWSKTNDFELTTEPDYNEFFDNSNVPHNVITAWYLDSIVTAKTEKIIFFYAPDGGRTLMNRSEQAYDILQIFQGCYTGNKSPHFYSASQELQHTVVPNTITFPNGSIEFHTTQRQDIKNYFGGYGGLGLDYIQEKDNNGTVIKKIKFYYSYFNQNDPDQNNKRWKLDSLQDLTDSVHPQPPYRMTYYNPDALPPKITKAIDHWGYYNRQTTNQTLLVPTFATDPIYKSYSGANRSPDTLLSSIQNGVLSALSYPTGGKSVFTYELNEYTNLFGNDRWDVRDTTISLGAASPGTPVRTASFTLTEQTEVTFYFNYQDPNNLDYRDEFIPDYAYLYQGSQLYETLRNAQYGSNGFQDITQKTLLLNPGTYTLRMDPLSYTFITYLSATFTARQLVNLRKGGGLRIKRIENFHNNVEKTVKRFLYTKNAVSTGQLIAPVAYDFITVLGGTSVCGADSYNLSANCLVRYSNNFSIEGFTRSGTIGYSKVTELSGENGENGKIEYCFYNNPPLYVQTPSLPYLNDAKNGKLLSVKYYDSGNLLKKKNDNIYAFQDPGMVVDIPGLKVFSLPFNNDGFYATLYPNLTSRVELSEESQVEYYGADSVKSTTNYFYENFIHKKITKMQKRMSNADVLTTTYKYAEDFKSSGSPNVYNTLANRNYHNPVIEESTFKNGSFLNNKRVNYDFWKVAVWGDNSAHLLLPKSIETKNGSEPVEERVAFKRYDHQGNLLMQSLSGGADVSYLWGYKNQYPVAEIRNAEYGTVIGVLGSSYLNNLSNQSEVTLSELSGLRAALYTALPNVQVVTYTYKPLVGMTSMTDAKGQTTYYEYDSYQRLWRVLDHQKKIIKQYCYNYAGQSIGCSVSAGTGSPGGPTDPTTPVNPQTVYARVEIHNVTTSVNANIEGYMGDVHIKFYSDDACLNALTLNSNLSVQMRDLMTAEFGGQSETTPYDYTYTATSGSSGIFIGNMYIRNKMLYYDPVAGEDYSDVHVFSLLPLSGNNYIIKPTWGDNYITN